MTRTWQKLLQQSCRQAEDLAAKTGWDPDQVEQMNELLTHYPMLVNPYYLSLIDFSDPADPIRRMSIPNFIELDKEGQTDTKVENHNTVLPGLQHKYRDTALVLSTDRCAMYCRHCFRKRLVGLDNAPYMSGCARDLDAVHAYLMEHPDISNVLVSGGDALMNSNERIRAILDMLGSVDTLDSIRIATRVPVSLPQRITTDDELVDILASYDGAAKLYMATQFDHPREITPEATVAVEKVLSLGIPVRNQTVLLRGVNADVGTLAELLKCLVGIGVEPYYVFQCRPVTGVKSQFQVPLREGVRIVEGAKALQNGFGKAFKYCMSHVTGKIEILGELPDGKMAFKYHEAKDRANLGRIFVKDVTSDQAWFEDDEEL